MAGRRLSVRRKFSWQSTRTRSSEHPVCDRGVARCHHRPRRQDKRRLACPLSASAKGRLERTVTSAARGMRRRRLRRKPAVPLGLAQHRLLVVERPILDSEPDRSDGPLRGRLPLKSEPGKCQRAGRVHATKNPYRLRMHRRRSSIEDGREALDRDADEMEQMLLPLRSNTLLCVTRSLAPAHQAGA